MEYTRCMGKKSEGSKLIDFKKNNTYSGLNAKEWMDRKRRIIKELYSLKEQPNAIPYITSYYKKDWGFCVTEREREIMEKEIHLKFV